MIYSCMHGYLHAYFTAYELTFVDNTAEQCTIRNKQITKGNAKFSPKGDQIISNQGGKKLLQVNIVFICLIHAYNAMYSYMSLHVHYACKLY